MTRYASIFDTVAGSLWPILPGKMDAILGFLQLKGANLTVDAATINKVAAANRGGREPAMTRSVAVLPIYGVIAQRMDLLSEFSGGCSTERVGRQFDALVNDPECGAIVLDVDSPGGNYYGTPELAEKIFNARGSKPIVAVANSMAASAAYWIASAADELCVTPSGDVGSIGVLAVHYDHSAFNAQLGVKPTYVTYGQHKAEFNQDSPLSGKATAELQARVNEAGETFVKAVAKQRGVAPQVVREKFGQGRMVAGKEAVDRGMADRVETLAAAIARLAGSKNAAIARLAGSNNAVSSGRNGVTSRQRMTIARYRLALEKFR